MSNKNSRVWALKLQNGSRHHSQIFIIFEGSTVLKKPEKNIGQKFTVNTYQSPRVPTDDYLASFNDSLLLNGCSIKVGPSSYLKYFCDLMRHCAYSQNSC